MQRKGSRTRTVVDRRTLRHSLRRFSTVTVRQLGHISDITFYRTSLSEYGPGTRLWCVGPPVRITVPVVNIKRRLNPRPRETRGVEGGDPRTVVNPVLSSDIEDLGPKGDVTLEDLKSIIVNDCTTYGSRIMSRTMIHPRPIYKNLT